MHFPQLSHCFSTSVNFHFTNARDFPGVSVVKIHLPMQETQVLFLDGEDPLEMDMATHSSILAWKIPWTEETNVLQSVGSQKSWT